LPNTAYAKLATGVPGGELAAQGLYYLFNSLSIDPLTLLAVLLAVTVTFARGPLSGWPLAAGVMLSLAYVVRIGGDFMAGRFLAAPLLVAALLLARINVTLAPLPLGLALAAMGAVALGSPTPNLSTTAFFFSDRAERRALVDERGITDERAIYYRYTGLLTARRGEPMPNHHQAALGRRLRAEGRRLIEHGQIGILGFHAGPGLHILESNALTDAFLARLPARPGWRIGHFGRRIPAGYEGTLRTGANRLTDPSLRVLYRKVALVTRGPLFDGERLAALWDLNFGPGRHVVDEYFVAHAGLQHAPLASLSVPRKDGDDPLQGTRRLSDWGLDVELGRLRHPLALELSLDQNDGYKLVCLNQGVALAERDLPPRIVPQGGLSVRRVELDRNTARWGCDVFRVLPVLGDQDYRLGHVAILDELPGAELEEPAPELASPEPGASEPPGEGEERKQDDRLPRGR
jgi:arabinofuranosyltransferase